MKSKNFFENYNPKICVSITDIDVMSAYKTFLELANDGVEVIEIRLDYLDCFRDKDKVKKLLIDCKEAFSKVIIIATIRSVNQGGKCDFELNEIEDYLLFIAKEKLADFLDVEFFEYDNPGRVLGLINEYDIGVIASHHEFFKTPSRFEMIKMMKRMEKEKCDVVKLAVMPNDSGDVDALIDVSKEFAESTKKNLITMSMGELGQKTRVCGKVSGSCLTFGAYKKSSAPGQLNYKTLRDLLSE